MNENVDRELEDFSWLKITVKGDCPVVHDSVEEWQKCRDCEQIGARILKSTKRHDEP